MKRVVIAVFCLAFSGPALAATPPDWDEAVRCAATLTVMGEGEADAAKAARRAYFVRKLRDVANLLGSQGGRQTTAAFNIQVGEQSAVKRERAARFARDATRCESLAEELYGAQYKPS